jgi:hypothetical protein
VAFGMLAKGARERLVDILVKGSCGEGGMNTVAAIHNNEEALCHPPKLEARSSKLELSSACGGGGRQRVENTSLPDDEGARGRP